MDGTTGRSRDASADPALLRTLDAAGLPATGGFRPVSGWVSRAWIGEEHVVRLTADERHRDAYRHEAQVIGLLAGNDVPHARRVASGEGPDGPWYVSERLPGRTLHEAWPRASEAERRAMIESLGAALRALHRIPAPSGLLPPWLEDALSGDHGPRSTLLSWRRRCARSMPPAGCPTVIRDCSPSSPPGSGSDCPWSRRALRSSSTVTSTGPTSWSTAGGSAA